MNNWERYFLAGKQAGCPKDQMQRFERADVILQQRQLVASAAARLCDQPDGPTAIGYGGSYADRGQKVSNMECGRTFIRLKIARLIETVAKG